MSTKSKLKSMRWFEANRETENARKRAWNAANPERVFNAGRKRRTGWTPEEYEQAFIAQDGRCATCDKPQSELSVALNADHNHTTGKKRGLLCRRCNLLLGHGDESIELFEKLAAYLRKYRI